MSEEKLLLDVNAGSIGHYAHVWELGEKYREEIEELEEQGEVEEAPDHYDNYSMLVERTVTFGENGQEDTYSLSDKGEAFLESSDKTEFIEECF